MLREGSEIRTPEDNASFSFFNSWSLDGSAHGGVGIILSPLSAKSLLEWEPISHRVARARFKGHLFNISVIVVGAPTRDVPEGETDLFYQVLTCTLKKVPKTKPHLYWRRL
jgi:hypothetical protein